MKQPLRVLIVDDEPQLRQYLALALADDGWETAEAESAEQAFEMLGEQAWPVVFCDVMLGGADGFSLLRRYAKQIPEMKIVLMTGDGTAVGALDAAASGAFDYLLKPFTLAALQGLSARLRERLLAREKHSTVKPGATGSPAPVEMVGRSTAFIEVMKQVGRVAPTNLPVLLAGETGTGKELAASALHWRSHRADQP